MNIEQRKLSDIQPFAHNPRDNDPAVDAVAESIRQFGFRQPLVLDEHDVIVVGETRYKAARKLGLESVPVHVATGLSPAQLKAYRIADNQTATLADWNHDLLTQELMELQSMDYNVDLLGFLMEELSQLLEDSEGQSFLADPDDVPEPPDEPVTRPGDLWLLDEHRLLCGDSTRPEDVDRLLNGAAVHLVNCDPPYNVKVEPRSNNAIAAGNSSFQRTHHQKLDLARHPEKAKGTTRKMPAKDRPLANNFVSDEEFDLLLRLWFGNVARVLLTVRAFYIWGGYAWTSPGIVGAPRRV